MSDIENLVNDEPLLFPPLKVTIKLPRWKTIQDVIENMDKDELVKKAIRKIIDDLAKGSRDDN